MADQTGMSRRGFMAGVSSASAAAWMGQKPARAAGAGDDLRVGIIGVGGRGGGVLGAIHKSPGVRVTAICDTHAGRLNSAAGTVAEDKPRLFSDYRDLIDYPELDAIFVETPCYLHAEMAIAVMKSGRHCYAEKPMALNVPDLNRMVATQKQAGVIYQVGTQLRYASPWQPAIRAILEGQIGPPILIRAHRHNVGDYPSHKLWFFKRALSGDTILEQAVHEFDFFCWIFGSKPPQRASGFGGLGVHKQPEWRDTMDYYTLNLDFGENQQVSYNHSWISSPKTYCDGRQEVVYGPKGAIDLENGKIFMKEGGDPISVSEEPKGNSTQLAVDDFFRCIRENDEPLANAEAGRNGALCGLLGLKAIDEERVVYLDELLKEG